MCAAVFYTREVGATAERRRADARDAASYRYAREAGAKIERTIAYARDAVWYRYIHKAIAIRERRIVYLIILIVIICRQCQMRIASRVFYKIINATIGIEEISVLIYYLALPAVYL